MKKYLIPEMEIELFDGQDLFTDRSEGCTGIDLGEGCSDDVFNNVSPWSLPGTEEFTQT